MKPGELRILNSQRLSAYGVYVVIAVGKQRIQMRRADMPHVTSQDIAVPITDLGEPLPIGRLFDLDTAPPAAPKPVPPAPEPEPVFVKLVAVRNVDVQLVRAGSDPRHPTLVLYKPGRVVRVVAGQEHREFTVNALDVDRFLNGVDGAYRADQEPITAGGFNS